MAGYLLEQELTTAFDACGSRAAAITIPIPVDIAAGVQESEWRGLMSAGVDPVVSARMSRIRGRDTAPEMKVRRELHRRGLRYRVNFKPVSTLKRTVDIAFTRQRVAVLIDGCFWHGCPEHFRPAKGDQRGFWAAKIAENQRRDRDSTRAFTLAGWTVLRFWEHTNPVEVADKVENEVIKRSVSRQSPSERRCR